MEEAVCTPVSVPEELRLAAAARAVAVNPANAPRADRIVRIVEQLLGPYQRPDYVLPPDHLALLTQKRWPAAGARLTVGFLEPTGAELRERILLQMNAWSQFCNVRFQWTQTDPQVRISRGPGGYWSYLGTDVLAIPAGRPTMNLEGFTTQTPESEFVRVVRHETGHTLGFPHEHMRRELVAKIDPAKAIAYYGRTQGWSAAEVRQQVLTPLEEQSVLGTERADETSVMCYQIPGSLTRDGRPILGGADISESDKAFAAKVYPKAEQPVTQKPHTLTFPGGMLTFTGGGTFDGKPFA